MDKIGYHTTCALEAIRTEGVVRPMRLPCVYLFTEAADAQDYAREFSYDAVVTVVYASRDVENSWKPAYAKLGKVLRLGPGRTARYWPGLVSSLRALLERKDE